MRFFISFLFMMCFAVAKSQTKKITPLQPTIMGTWTSLDDNKYKIVFTTNTKLDYYGTELEAKYSYRINKDSLITKDKKTGAIYNYSIEGLTSKNLTLMYLVRGNLLKFRKK